MNKTIRKLLKSDWAYRVAAKIAANETKDPIPTRVERWAQWIREADVDDRDQEASK